MVLTRVGMLPWLDVGVGKGEESKWRKRMNSPLCHVREKSKSRGEGEQMLLRGGNEVNLACAMHVPRGNFSNRLLGHVLKVFIWA